MTPEQEKALQEHTWLYRLNYTELVPRYQQIKQRS